MVLPYRLNASIIARKDSKYLLVKKPRDKHAWQFPQGGMEAGESFQEAALREFREEIGTDKISIIGSERTIHHYDWHEKIKDERLRLFRGQEVHLFLADFLGEDSDISLDKNELAEWRWVSTDELSELIESPEYLKIILEIINNGKDNSAN